MEDDVRTAADEQRCFARRGEVGRDAVDLAAEAGGGRRLDDIAEGEPLDGAAGDPAVLR